MNHTDLILNTPVEDTVQGHVGQNTKQRFDTLTAVPFSHPRLKLAGYEFLMRDQFGNYYHKMRAVLFDGELYDVDQYIKPSMMMKHGGGHADFEDRAAKQRLRITEDLLKELRENGALSFGRANVMIMQASRQALAPIALETKDITHAANLLEDKLTQEDRLADAVAAAKRTQGEAVPTGPVEAPDFVPISKAPYGSDLERSGNIIAFPSQAPATPAAKSVVLTGVAKPPISEP